MSSALSAADDGRTEAEKDREARAARQHVTLLGHSGDLDLVFDFEGSDDTHVVHVDGSEATFCTCPDHQHRGVRCKHMAAAEDFSLIDAFEC
jgi:hypothetical protein